MRNEAVEKIFEHCADVVDKKNTDYGRPDDFYYNFRGAEELGIPMWVGIAVRYQDKYRRLSNAVHQFNTTGKIVMKNETMEDTLIDSINYLALILATYNDWKNEKDEHR